MKSFHTMTAPMARRGLLCSLIIFGLLRPSLAQVTTTTITPDGSLGTTVSQSGSVHTIDGGTMLGPNQFHSFDRFDVGTNDTARFTGPASVENILSRVTGGVGSMIDGTLQSDIAGANLYLLNPNGVMFGPNAQLDVMGSFHVSTADILKFDDGSTFSVDLGDQRTLMTVSAPVAFGFLQAQPATITVARSQLEVPEGETLSVVGGNVDVTGDFVSAFFGIPTLAAPGGRMQLVSVGSSGEVGLDASQLSLNSLADSFEQLGQLNISDNALVVVSSESSSGTVVIRGNRLRVDNALIFADTLGEMDGATIGIDIQVEEDVVLANGALVTTDVFGSGSAGDIRVHANRLDVMSEAILGSRPLPDSSGAGGNIDIQVKEDVVLANGALVTTDVFGSGAAGDIRVHANRLDVMGEAILGSRPVPDSLGAGGNVELRASILNVDERGQISTSTFGRGRGGNVVIEAESVRLADGAQIISHASGEGDAGMVMVAADTISLTVNDIDPFFVGGSISSNTFGEGNAGTVTVVADSISLTNGSISSNASGEGNAGTVTVVAGTLSLSGMSSFISSASTADGDAGTVTVTADTVFITDDAFISNSTFREGEAGTVIVTADTVTLTAGGAITSAAAVGSGGNAGTITVTAEAVLLTDFSEIRASSGTSGNAGIITISAGNVSLTDHSNISSNAFGEGDAGTVIVMADTLSLADNSEIRNTTTSDNAPGNITGMVNIVADTISLINDSSIDSETSGSGDGGLVTVSTNNISLTGFSEINSDSSGAGDAGDVMIHAREALTLEESSRITSRTNGVGDAGGIAINVEQLVANGNSRITSSSRSGATGRAGTVVIEGAGGSGTMARLVTLSNADVETQANGADGGNILVVAETIELTEGARITAASNGEGIAGNININTLKTLLIDQSDVNTSASQADGGDVRITSDFIQLRDGRIVTSVGSGAGQGGNITVDTNLGLLVRSEIRADAFGGPGGNITIQSNGFITDLNSAISASSQQSVDGTVDIQGLDDLSGSLTALDPDFAATAALRTNRCARRILGEGISRFTVSGRNRLPTDPGKLLPSPSVQISVSAIGQQAGVQTAQLGQGQPHPAAVLTSWHRDCRR